MEKKCGPISRCYLNFKPTLYAFFVFLVIETTLQAVQPMDHYDGRFSWSYGLRPGIQTTIGTSQTDTTAKGDTIIVYPGRPLIMSLVLPGAGQVYNRSSIWKVAFFAGIEVAGFGAQRYYIDQAEKLRKDFELFADVHWTILDWVENTKINPPAGWSRYRDIHIKGTHKLFLHLRGVLAAQYGEYVISDSLENHPEWVYSPEYVTVVRDRNFYENIGKYDQFVGGWDDAYGSWEEIEKDVGDSLEIIITTPNKQKYRQKRFDSNLNLTRAKYAVSALMFNHVFSGLEAVITAQRKAKSKRQVDTTLSLLYNPDMVWGIGGIAVVMEWN